MIGGVGYTDFPHAHLHRWSQEILFKENFLVLITPPYLVVYRIEDPENPATWKALSSLRRA
jgi:hypothetical protein